MKKIVLFCLVFLLTGSVFAAKVDLSVSQSEVTISPAQPTAGDPISITVKVRNLGSKASKASVVKLIVAKENKVVFKQKNPIPSIAPGESYDTIFNLGSLTEGNYTSLIKVDPANLIPEINEGNNKVTLNLVVLGGSSGGGTGQIAANIIATTFSSSFEAFDNIGRIGGRNKKLSFLENIFNLFRFARNPEDTVSCSKSGTMTMNYQLDGYMRPVKMEFAYNNCEDWEDQSTNSYVRQNGSIAIDVTYLSDDISSPDFYTISQMVIKLGDGDPSSDTLPDYTCEYYENGAFSDSNTSDYTLTVSIYSYDANGMPTHLGMYLNGTMVSIRQDKTCTATFNNLHYDVLISGTEEDMTISLTVSGTASWVYDNNQAKKVTVTYDNVNISSHTWGTVTESTINGQMVVQSPCYSGTISIETLQPIHEVENSKCPDGGVLKIMAGGKSATVTFNSDGSVSVDENSDGSIDYTFSSCSNLFEYPC